MMGESKTLKLIGQLQFIRDYECKTEDEVKAMCKAIRILSELPSAKPNKHLWFMVGETLVSESKRHITAEQAIERIRQYMQEAELPPAQPQDKVLLDKEVILQAGYQGKEVEFHIGGRLFAIREKAQ